MKVVKLNKPDGTLIAEIKLPDNPSELPLANYVSFMAEADKISLPGANVVAVMAKAVAELSGVPFDDVLRANFGDEWEQNSNSIDGIRSMYGWAVESIGKWKGHLRGTKDCKVTYQGQKFEIPVMLVNSLGGRILPDVDVNSAVEAYEVVRLFERRISAGASVRECVTMLQTLESAQDKEPYIKRLRSILPHTNSVDILSLSYDDLQEIISEHGDENGDNAYSRYLHMLAILLRKPGETLPTDESKKQSFLAERAAFFQQIDTQTALDIDFFLLSTLTALGKKHHVIGSLTHQALGRVVETRKQKGRRTNAPSNTTKRFSAVSGGRR